MPSWENLHPLVVHFPIACLLVTPLFLALSLGKVEKTQAFGWSAFLLLILGTSAVVLAVETGEAASKVAWHQMEPEALNIKRIHTKWAGMLEFFFVGFTGTYGVYETVVWK